MTYFELVTEARRTFDRADATSITEHVAIQFNATGNAQGAFYLEVRDGRIHVEPYDYHDHDAMVTGTAEAILDFLTRKEHLADLIREDRLSVEGYLDKVERIDAIVLPQQERGL